MAAEIHPDVPAPRRVLMMRFAGLFRRIAGALGALLLFTFTIVPAAAQGLPVSTLSITAHDGKVHEFRGGRCLRADPRDWLDEPHVARARQGNDLHFPQAKEVSMWMKDTLLPLDMIFIDASGKIINIAQNARPMDETIISSGGFRPMFWTGRGRSKAASSGGWRQGQRAGAFL